MKILKRKDYVMSECVVGRTTLKVIPKGGLEQFEIGQEIRIFDEKNKLKYRQGKISKVSEHKFLMHFVVGFLEEPKPLAVIK